MMKVSLEDEFEQYKACHKYSVLKAKMIDYYTTLDMGKVNLPNFLRNDSPEKRADEELRNIISMPDGMKRFNELYEIAWESIAELMD